MSITIIAVGKLKEKYFKDGIEEYMKRLSSYVDMKVIEVADEKAPEELSESEMEIVKDREGERILSKIPKNSHVIAMEIGGVQMSSETFADKIDSLNMDGVKNIVFIIGGSLGLSKNVLAESREYISFSKLTFPHQLMRLILVEQIYRAHRIINNHPYHK